MNNSKAKQVLSIIFDAPTAYDQDVISALETITIDELIRSLSKWHGSRVCIHSASGYSYTIRLYAGTFLLLINKDNLSDCVAMTHNWHGRIGNCFDALQAIE